MAGREGREDCPKGVEESEKGCCSTLAGKELLSCISKEFQEYGSSSPAQVVRLCPWSKHIMVLLALRMPLPHDHKRMVKIFVTLSPAAGAVEGVTQLESDMVKMQ